MYFLIIKIHSKTDANVDISSTYLYRTVFKYSELNFLNRHVKHSGTFKATEQ